LGLPPPAEVAVQLLGRCILREKGIINICLSMPYQALVSTHPRFMIYSKSRRKYDTSSLMGFKMTVVLRDELKLNQKSCA
jgi:hypothetical protein